MGRYMSVKEMGDLLGIKKTDRYWLVKKGYFNVVNVAGKMWVETDSFEKWYARQIKYHKVTGEEPGMAVRKNAYTPREAASLLGVSDGVIYDLIKKGCFEPFKLDGWMMIPKKDFHRWLKGQDRYRLAGKDCKKQHTKSTRPGSADDRPAERHLRKNGTGQSGIGKNKAGEPADLIAQRKYIPGNTSRGEQYLTIEQTCWIAGVSRQTITTWYQKGKIPVIRIGKVVRIPLSGLEKMLELRESARGTERSKEDGNDQKTRKGF